MNAKISFLKGVSLGLVALGIALGHSASGYAAAVTKTWNGSTATSGAYLWSTAGNWTASGVPASGDNAVFGNVPNKTVTIATADTNDLQNVTFNNAGYQLVGAKYLVLRSSANIILSNSGTTQIQKIQANGNFNVKGGGTLSVLSDIKTTTPRTMAVLENSTVILTADFSPTNNLHVNNNAGTVKVSGYTILGDVQVGSTSTSTLTGYGDGTNFSKLSTDSLTYQSNGVALVNINGNASSGKYDQFNASATNSATSSGDITFGGQLQLNFQNSFIPQSNQTYNLFSTLGGTFNSDFASVAATTVGSDTVTWTSDSAGNWTSTAWTGGDYMIFNANNGQLVVVPEPSTIVFAGVGVAMAGWSAWKKRRLAKA